MKNIEDERPPHETSSNRRIRKPGVYSRPGLFMIWFLSALISLFFATFCYIYYLQSVTTARRETLAALVIWAALTPVVHLLLIRLVLPGLRGKTRSGRRAWLTVSALSGVLVCVVTVQPDYIYVTLPKQSLWVDIPAGASDRTLTLQWFHTSLGDVSFAELQPEGNWERDERGFHFSGASRASFRWTGRTGESADLIFSAGMMPEPVEVVWNGVKFGAYLGGGSAQSATITQSFALSPFHKIPIFIVTWFVSTFLFLILTLFLVGVRLSPVPVVHRKGWYWLLYTLPMIAVWGIYQLTFFPAIMTPDSIRQWGQVIGGQFNDALPVVHTLLVILLTRIWFSPAAVVIFQVITLALTVAWGIKILSDHGLPAWAGWGLSILFAISPVNGYMAATLWKDIPYSTCLLLMSLMFLKVVLSRGEWLKRKSTWLWLVLVSLGISLFRLNGLPVPVVSLIVLALVYREHWKRVTFSLGIFLGVWILIQGPIYDYLKVDRNTGFKQQVFIHHIAAHVATGGPLTTEEASLASGILPLDQWDYDCCTNIPIWRQPAYSEPRFTEKATDIRKLFMGLAFKEPGVEFRHMVCVSSLIWELPNHCALKQEKIANRQPTWIEPNDLGLKEKSLLPVLAAPLTMIKDFASRQPWDLFFYTPAVFLFLGLYCTVFFAYRAKQSRYLLYFLPAAVQSAIMLLINVSRDFRYQYGVYLVGLFSLGLLILALTQAIRNPNPSSHEIDKT